MDFISLLDKAKTLGFSGEEAKEFISRMMADISERDMRAAAREAEKVKLEREEREKEREEREKEREEREKERQHELAVISAKTNPEYTEAVTHGPPLSLPKIPPFDEKVDEIDLYIDRFEKLASFHKWEENTYATMLGTLLRGKALKVYCSLSPSLADNFGELKKALLNAFHINYNVYRKRFRESVIQNDESFVQFNCRLGQNFDKWISSSDVEKNYEGLRDFMISDQFLSSCSLELRSHLLEQTFKNSKELAEIAERFLIAHGKRRCQKGSKPFSKVNSSDKGASDNKGNKNTGKHNPVKCHYCGEEGHIKPNCPKLKLNQQKTDEKPLKINVVLDREEKLSGIIDTTGIVFNKKVECVFDTGCNTVVLRESLVPSKLANGKKVKVFDYLGRPLYLRSVTCFLKCKFYSGKVKAVIAPIKCTDVIVGLIPGLKENVLKGLDAINGTENTTDSSTTTHSINNVDTTVSIVTRSQTSNVSSVEDKIQTQPVEDTNFVDFAYYQNTCDSLKGIREHLANEDEIKVKDRIVKYIKVGDLIYRKCISSKNMEEVNRMQLVIPQNFRKKIMKLSHESLMAGHFSSRKTTDKIFHKFYWPRAGLEISNFCKSCHICQKVGKKPKKVPLVKMPIVNEPFSRVAIDLVGPITPASQRGHRYILTIIDLATRFPEAIPLRNIDTVSVSEALLDVFCRVGVPHEILSDNGTQFTSDLMQEINKLLSIKAIYTSPYHAQCNGTVERLNGTLKSILKKVCSDKPKDWDRYINIALFAYREIPHDTLKYSPFELLYGRNVRGPLAIYYELLTNREIDENLKPVYQYVVDLREKLHEIAEAALENSKVNADKVKQYYDKKTKPRKFKVDSEVLVMLPTSTNKFVMQWKGPFKVVRCHSNGVDYYIKVGNKTKIYHANMLKEYIRRPQVNAIVAEEPHIKHSSDLFVNDNKTEIPMEDCLEDYFPDLSTKTIVNVNEALLDEQKVELDKLLRSYTDVLSDIPGRTKALTHSIKLNSSEPIRVKHYPIPVHLEDEFNKEVDKMLKMDIIQPSNSDFSSPVVLLRKKDKSIRLCVDFRELNKQTIFDAEPMPNIGDNLHKFRNAKYFTELDLLKGYWQVPLDPESHKYTAFATKYGLMEFKVLPFGLSTACATFVRLMRNVLKGLQNVSCYFDNIVIFSENWDDHLLYVKCVLDRLRENGLTAGPSKCYFGFFEITYLGYQLGNNALSPIPSRIDAIVRMPLPENKKALRSFMGTIGYYNRFIKEFSTIAAPINELLKKNTPNKLQWNEKQTSCFNRLKSCLMNGPILALPNIDKVFYLRTDASYTGLGAVVLQEHDDILKPVCFAGKKLNKSELNYSPIEKECYAIVWGVEKFKEYLYGKEFILQTDHKPLQHLKSMRNNNDRLMRWSLRLQPYTFVVEHIRGVDNIASDMISRCC